MDNIHVLQLRDGGQNFGVGARPVHPQGEDGVGVLGGRLLSVVHFHLSRSSTETVLTSRR